MIMERQQQHYADSGGTDEGVDPCAAGLGLRFLFLFADALHQLVGEVLRQRHPLSELVPALQGLAQSLVFIIFLLHSSLFTL